MSDVYKLQYNGMTLAYPGWNGYVGYEQLGYPITYLSDDHVSVTGDTTLYIPGSTGITLQTGYDTYYRISGYDVTGGTVENGVLIPTGPCTIRAVEKVNYFTATGTFNYSNNTGKNNKSNTYSAIVTNYTGSIPSNCFGQSSAWNPSNLSAYSAHITPIVQVWGYAYIFNFTGQSKVNNTNLTNRTAKLQSTNTQPNPSTDFNLTANTTTQGPLKLYLTGNCAVQNAFNFGWRGITGNAWTATGIAP